MARNTQNSSLEFNRETTPSQVKKDIWPDLSSPYQAIAGFSDYRTAKDASLSLLAFDNGTEKINGQQIIAKDPLHELMAQSFYLEIPTGSKPSDLVKAGVVDGNLATDIGDRRSPSRVRHIVIKETSQEPLGQAANYLISDKHIAISQLLNPDRLLKHKHGQPQLPSDEIVVYLDDGAQGHHHQLSERQKASLRLLLHWSHNHYRKAHAEENLPADVAKALNDEIKIPNEKQSEKTDGYNPHPWPWWMRKDWSKESPATSDDTCGKMANVPPKDTTEYDQFVDKLTKVLSVNEGKKTEINRDDNGSGISVGEAQWNQKKGELPNLLQAWLDKDQEFFKNTFAPYLDQMLTSAGKINDPNIRSMEMGTNDDFIARMQDALNYEAYQKVQDKLVRDKAEKSITVAAKYNHQSQRFVAEVLDVANQKGWGGCEARLRKANVAAIPEEEECTAIKKFEEAASDRVNAKQRDKNLDKMFAPDRTAVSFY